LIFDAEVSLATGCRLETADFRTSMLKPIVWVASVSLRDPRNTYLVLSCLSLFYAYFTISVARSHSRWHERSPGMYGGRGILALLAGKAWSDQAPVVIEASVCYLHTSQVF
jgi:hypothetical protein